MRVKSVCVSRSRLDLQDLLHLLEVLQKLNYSYLIHCVSFRNALSPKSKMNHGFSLRMWNTLMFSFPNIILKCCYLTSKCSHL